jgi:pSer/pThr/pTyr-binding forkhead associated (FHA) protein
MIGRLGDQVDYCVSNPAIGKLHAELIRKENAYYITDMNSRNGSFVNGTRVEAGQEMPIKDGDRILLANEEFMFCDHQ